MKSENNLICDSVDNEFHLYPKYSELELLVQEDMIKAGITYPFCSVDDVKDFWKQRLS